ncbi:hypothetical protein CNEO_2470019 [Clostridium neonatale]|nr:hypothetical protein CNEO_2470019 [Clostridium neonatale]
MSCPKIYFKSKKCTNKNPPKNFIIFLGGLDKKKSYLNDIDMLSNVFSNLVNLLYFKVKITRFQTNLGLPLRQY